MKSKWDVNHAMKHFFKNFGIPSAAITKFSVEQVQGEAQRICEKVGWHIRHLEKSMTWYNCAEQYVDIFKKDITND